MNLKNKKWFMKKGGMLEGITFENKITTYISIL